MTNDKLQKLIAKEESNIKALDAKIAELTEKKRKSENKLKEYRTMENSQKFSALSDIVEKSGLSVEEILFAIQNGDMLTLQEKMEASLNDNKEDGEDYGE